MNRLSSKTIGGKCPFELVFHKEPSFDHLKVIGCLCYAANLMKNHKFSARAIPAVLLGYYMVQKGYNLYDLTHHWSTKILYYWSTSWDDGLCVWGFISLVFTYIQWFYSWCFSWSSLSSTNFTWSFTSNSCSVSKKVYQNIQASCSVTWLLRNLVLPLICILHLILLVTIPWSLHTLLALQPTHLK